MTKPRTVGELRQTGYAPRSVKAEIRQNLIRKLERGERIFPGIVGYDETVLPQIENALLSGQDLILLGERGQAKSRLARALVTLLDEAVPALAGSEVNDDPLQPISKAGRELVAELGDRAPVEWLPRERRYGEKLATPDITIADLIGEVDPIKVAEGRYLGDELTIHYGLLPRTHRGIFVLNELPDLAERIQVGLLNIMEERDVQIRGYRVRLPARPPGGRLREPRGLHEPRSHHHAAQGPVRLAGAHPLPAHARRRAGHRRAGGHALRRRRLPGRGAGLHAGDRRRADPPVPPEPRDQPAERGQRPRVDHELREPGLERPAPGRAAPRAARRAAGFGSSRDLRVDGGQDRAGGGRGRRRRQGAGAADPEGRPHRLRPAPSGRRRSPRSSRPSAGG